MPDHRTSAFAGDTNPTEAFGGRADGALGLAAASWVVAVGQMNRMDDMGAATELGSFGFFIAVRVSMMAAMMLPGAAPAVVGHTRASGRVHAAPVFIGSYLAVWTVVGVAVYAAYRPHGSLAAGTVAVAAGVYKLTPVKRHFRMPCTVRPRVAVS